MAKKNEPVDRDFQDLFLKSPLGPKVLGKILDDCNFCDIAGSQEEQMEQNHTKLILTWSGIGMGMTGLQYVKALAGHKVTNALEPDAGEDEED